MRRLLLLAVFGFAFPASASPPMILVQQWEGSFDAAAGEFCDFPFHQDWIIQRHARYFFDEAGNYDHVVRNYYVWAADQNAETGYTLIDEDHYTAKFDWVTGVASISGVVWKLSEPNGKVVFVGAGHAVWDGYTGEDFTQETPHLSYTADGVEIICRLLGGAPAP